ncbi:MAG: terminase large subunit [Dietzia sp.]|nr:terminase large subunit [Dietzia sp.]
MGLPVGPKKRVSLDPLGFDATGKPSERFAEFCETYLTVPKGHGVGEPVRLRDWQVGLMASVMDPEPRPSIAGFMLGRSSGKTHLMACWMVYELFCGPEGNQLVCVAVDERQAHLLFETAAAMVQLSPELSARCVLFRDKMECPGRRSTFSALPAEAKRLEGLGNFSLAVADEIGVIGKDTWTTLLLGLGKVENATVVGLGTPSVSDESVLLDLRRYGQDHPDDRTFVWREYSAAGFEDHPVDCRHCWRLACPALGDFSSEAAMTALLPPKTPEGAFRRARLCQFVPENEHPFIPADVWRDLGTGESIPDGAEVVLALDGSFGGANADTTALLLGTVSPQPHFQTLRLWESDGTPSFRVNVPEVEDEIRAAAKRWQIKELILDPFRWNRTGQVLSSVVAVSEFPWSPARVTKATTDLYSAATNGNMTHSGDEPLTRHVMAATVVETADGGLKIGKTSRKRSAQKVDLAACLVMAHSRAVWLGTRRKRARVIGV